VRSLFDRVAGGVYEFDGSEVEISEWGFDFGAIADGDDDEMVGVNVRFCYPFDVLWSDGEVGCGQCCVVVEGTLIEEDGGHRACGGVGGFELAGERLNASDLGLFHLRFGWRF